MILLSAPNTYLPDISGVWSLGGQQILKKWVWDYVSDKVGFKKSRVPVSFRNEHWYSMPCKTKYLLKFLPEVICDKICTDIKPWPERKAVSIENIQGQKTSLWKREGLWFETPFVTTLENFKKKGDWIKVLTFQVIQTHTETHGFPCAPSCYSIRMIYS